MERLTGPRPRHPAGDGRCRARGDGALPGLRPRSGGGQWQQTGTLLERFGLPDALELWEAAVLEKGARKGDFTEADLDALMGGELALVVTPLAVQRVVEIQKKQQDRAC